MAELVDDTTDQVHGDVGSRNDREQSSETCEPCKIDNSIQPAYGWCETCDELLCNDCYKAHCKPSLMRNHQLWPLQDMENRKKRKKVTNKCKKHGNEALIYFCDDHTELGCNQCFVSKHRQCSKVVCISEVNTTESDEFKTLQLLLSEIGKRLNTITERTEINESITNRQHAEAIAGIQEAGETLKTFIDTLVKEQIVKAEQAKSDNIRNIGEVKEMNEEIAIRLSTVRDMLAAEQGDNNQLFITMKHLQAEAKLLESKLGVLEQKNYADEYEFVFNPELSCLLEMVTEFGYLKDMRELNMNKATDEVEDEFELRVLRKQQVWGRYQEDDETLVTDISTDRDIRLLYVLLYRRLTGATVVGLNIYEHGGSPNLSSNICDETCEDIIAVKVVDKDGVHGITLQAGHQYHVFVLITCSTNTSCLGEPDNSTVGGVKFTFSNNVKVDESPVDRSLIRGFRFVPL